MCVEVPVMSAYLLTAVLLISTAPALAQQQTIHTPDTNRIREQQPLLQAVPRKPEPFPPPSGAFWADLEKQPGFVSSDLRALDDTVCYSMRSYVVARDRKHSDSVHSAGYSTCQPASKYRLRTTETRTDSASR